MTDDEQDELDEYTWSIEEDTYFEDLTPCDYFDRGRYNLNLTAVGWVRSDHPVGEGFVKLSFLEKLERLFQNPWAPCRFMGWHTCNFCNDRENGAKGVSNLFVPWRGQVFVAPQLILHYISEHNYCPPPEFQEAVLECPEMSSPEYLTALKECGIPPTAIS